MKEAEALHAAHRDPTLWKEKPQVERDQSLWLTPACLSGFCQISRILRELCDFSLPRLSLFPGNIKTQFFPLIYTVISGHYLLTCEHLAQMS